MENLDYENKNIKGKYLEIMRNHRILKIKNSPSELEKYFLELKSRERKDRKKIKREIEELFHKPIIVTKDNLDEFKEQETKK